MHRSLLATDVEYGQKASGSCDATSSQSDEVDHCSTAKVAIMSFLAFAMLTALSWLVNAMDMAWSPNSLLRYGSTNPETRSYEKDRLKMIVNLTAVGPTYVELDDLGWVEGVAYPSVRLFLGIQYGTSKRWGLPKAIKPWRPKTYVATGYGPVCPSSSYNEALEIETGMEPNSMLRSRADLDWGTDEDCLFMNVYTPGPAVVTRIESMHRELPVLLWLHGGSFKFGAGSDITSEDVAVLTTRSVVVVTVNYRLGAFGFLASPKLGPGSGNLGLLDQRLAMNFVKKNIHAFGGDAQRITVFGWSAGAASISAHLTMHESRGLFRSAIMQSGGFAPWTTSLAVAKNNFLQILSCLKCDVLPKDQWTDCMRSVSTQRILDCSAPMSFGPTYGTEELPLDPVVALRSGAADASVPIIIGSALYDSVVDLGVDATRSKLHHYINTRLAGNRTAADEAWRLYDPGQSAFPRLGWSASYWAAREFGADSTMTCIARRVAAQWASEGKAPAYWYQWAYDVPLSGRALQIMARRSRAQEETQVGSCWPCPGAGHGAELPFLFQDAAATTILGEASNDEKLRVIGLGSMPPVDLFLGIGLADDVQNLWISFARDPWSVETQSSQARQTKVSQWQHVQPAEAGIIQGAGPALLLEGSGVLSPLVHAYKAERCNFWDTQSALNP